MHSVLKEEVNSSRAGEELRGRGSKVLSILAICFFLKKTNDGVCPKAVLWWLSQIVLAEAKLGGLFADGWLWPSFVVAEAKICLPVDGFVVAKAKITVPVGFCVPKG